MTTPDACPHCGKEWLATCYVCADKMSEKLEAAESRLALLESVLSGVEQLALMTSSDPDFANKVAPLWRRFRADARGFWRPTPCVPQPVPEPEDVVRGFKAELLEARGDTPADYDAIEVSPLAVAWWPETIDGTPVRANKKLPMGACAAVLSSPEKLRAARERNPDRFKNVVASRY